MKNKTERSIFKLIFVFTIATLTASVSYAGGSGKFTVSSPAFERGGPYPTEFTCDGSSSSPPVEWSGVPAGTKSFALNLWHTSRSGENEFSYWLLYNIPANVHSLPINVTGIGTIGWFTGGKGEKGAEAGGKSKIRENGYNPMCSKGGGASTYNITIFALSEKLKFNIKNVSRLDLLSAIKDITLAKDTLPYTYERKGRAKGSKKGKKGGKSKGKAEN